MMHIEKSKIQGIIVDVSIRGYGKKWQKCFVLSREKQHRTNTLMHD